MNQHLTTLLRNTRRIAVVGLSDQPWRTSYQIAQTLLAHGYTVLPVNPNFGEWNGIPAWPDLASVPGPVDMVNVFRRSEFVSGIVDEAIAIGAQALWTQLGVVDWEAGERAERAGLHVVMDRCIAVELSRMG
ncbi:MAG: CoA-binding protein [Bacteroidetes bacterium]|nr:CoA-binding protein [Bacteroidota bacterium]